MTRFLLDTNVVSESIRREPRASTVRALAQHSAEVAIPAPVWHELLYGCRRLPPSRRKSAIERYLDQFVLTRVPILAYDQVAAAIQADERTRLERAGRSIGFVDSQIAAIAIRDGLTLVTFNRKDFADFRNLELATW